MAEPQFQDSKRDFCKDLVAAREYKDLDLNKVADRTKISIDYLKKLEGGDWDFLPTSYVRAFLRTYAQVVGMDVGEVLERFDRIAGVTPTPVPGMGFTETTPGKKPRAESGPTQPKFTLADEPSGRGGVSPGKPVLIGGAIVIALAILFAVYFFLIAPGEENKKEAVKEIPFEDVVSETLQSDTLETGEADSLTNNAAQLETDVDLQGNNPGAMVDEEVGNTDAGAERLVSEQLTLNANVSQACYMMVITDHDTSDVFDNILQTGATRSFTADSVFRVVIGNTNGVDLMLNGRRLRDIGRRGRVVTLTIDQNGIREAQAGNRELNRPDTE